MLHRYGRNWASELPHKKNESRYYYVLTNGSAIKPQLLWSSFFAQKLYLSILYSVLFSSIRNCIWNTNEQSFTKRKLIHERIHSLEAWLQDRHFVCIRLSRWYCANQMDGKIVINDCTQDLITTCIVVSWITMFINFPFHRKSVVHTHKKIASQKQLSRNTI